MLAVVLLLLRTLKYAAVRLTQNALDASSENVERALLSLESIRLCGKSIGNNVQQVPYVPEEPTSMLV